MHHADFAYASQRALALGGTAAAVLIGAFSVNKKRVFIPGGSSLEENQLILEVGTQGEGRPNIQLTQEIDLLLADDPSPYKQALGNRLEQLHQSLGGWVLPRIFATADGNSPPIIISFAPQNDA